MKAAVMRANNAPFDIEEVEIEDHKDMQKHIGCDLFTTAQQFGDNHTLWVDDEGWIPRENAPKHMFRIAPEGVRYEHLEFAGNGLLVRTDEEGETIDVMAKAHGFLSRNIEFSKDEITDEIRAKKLGDGFQFFEISK